MSGEQKITKAEKKRRADQSRKDKERHAKEQLAKQQQQPKPKKAPPPPKVVVVKNRQGYAAVAEKAHPGIQAMLKALMLPSTTVPIRFPLDKPEYTALHKFKQMTPIQFPINDNVSNVEEGRVMLFRDPCFPVWLSNSDVPANCTASKFIRFNRSETGYVSPNQIPVTTGGSVDLNITHSENYLWGSAGTDTAKFGKLVVGTSHKTPGINWFYVPRGFRPALYLTIKGGSLNGSYYNVVMWHTADGHTENATSTLIDCQSAGLNVNTSCAPTTVGGWFRFESIQCTVPPTTPPVGTEGYMLTLQLGWCSSGTLSTPTVQTMANTTLMEPVSSLGMPGFDKAPTLYERCRVSASSLLMTNVTAALNAEGNIRAYQVRSRAKSPWGLAVNAENELSSHLQWTGPAKKGFYTYTTWQMADQGFRDTAHLGYTEDRSGTGSHYPCFLLDYHDWFYSIHVDPIAQAQTFNVVYDSHLESVTDSQLWGIGLSPYSYEDGRRCQTATMEIKPFTENPVHIPTLLKAAVAMAMRILRGNAGTINPMLHNVVNSLVPLG